MVLVRGGIAVKPHVQRAADAVVAEFGASLSPGTYPGHSPPEGPTQALDLFTPQTPAGWALQGRIADFLIANARRLGVRYVIKWNPNGADWIWNIERAAEGWRAMATRDHRNHVHVTFYATAPDSTIKPPAPAPGAPASPDQPSQEDDMTIFGDAPDGRPDGLWMLWGGLRKRVHTPEAFDAYRKLGARHIGDVDPTSGGKFPLALFDATVDIEAALAARIVVPPGAGGEPDYTAIADQLADVLAGRLAG